MQIKIKLNYIILFRLRNLFLILFSFQGDICGSGVKYPLIGAIREELLGIPRDVIAPGIEPADIDWETVSTALAPVQATTLPPATRIDINSVR